MQQIPTLCDRCRAEGNAGDAPFADLEGLLDFDPVPLRRTANAWTPEHQRAFIAALAVTGNERTAARSIGRYAGGAQRLRSLPRGKKFAEAWDNAVDLYRERELAMLTHSMGELADEHRKHADQAREVAEGIDYHRQPEPEGGGLEMDPEAVEDARGRIAERLWGAKRLLLETLAEDPAKRAAYELITGEDDIDWEAAAKGEPQMDELSSRLGPFVQPPPMREAAMVLVGPVVGGMVCGEGEEGKESLDPKV